MGFYDDAFPGTRFHTNARGQLVFVVRLPGKRPYIVPPDRAAALKRFERRYVLLFFVALPVLPLLSRSPWVGTALALVWIAGFALKLWHFTKGLERASEMPEPNTAAIAGNASRRARVRRGMIMVAAILLVMVVTLPWYIHNVPRTIRALVAAPAYVGFLWWMFRSPRPSVPRGDYPA